MLISVSAGSSLAKHLPPNAKGNRVEIDIPAGSTVQDVLTCLKLDPQARFILILNGDMLSRPEFTERSLVEGDKLSLMPPIKAG